jgi:Cu+-exporting ATPase
VVTGKSGGYSDSLSGLIFFLLLGKFYQGKTYQALSFERDYKSYFPVAVTKITEQNKEEILLLSEIQLGDRLMIRNKELIPADCILEDGLAMIDYSFVTGESNPVKKQKGDFIYAGGRQTGGAITIKVDKEVEQSHLTKLWNEDENEKNQKAKLSSLVDKISEYFTITVILIAALGFAYWAYQGVWETAIFVFTAVLIVACPCALALSIPFTFGNTMSIFGNLGLYIKNLDVIERLHQVNTIVFDKTGTITKPDIASLSFNGAELSNDELSAIMSVAKQSTHPLSSILAKYYENYEYYKPEHFVEMEGRGSYGTSHALNIKLGSEEYVTNKESENKKEKTSRVYLSINDVYKGFWEISNTYRDGLDTIINDLKSNFDLYLLSGDNDAEKEKLSKYFSDDKMLFNQKPQDKKDFIAQLQTKGKTVLMTGDGLNDAGALMQADVALTVADDVYHFSPAGDAILEAKQFYKLSKFIRFTAISLKIVKVSFAISFFYNVIGIAFALSGYLSPVIAALLMPISSISVVSFATFVTRFMGRNLKK